MSINYPSFPKNINTNKINADEVTASFSGSFFGNGSGLTNIATGSSEVYATNNLTGSGTVGNPLDLKQSISLLFVTASLIGNATSADFATTATSATVATTADFASSAGTSTFSLTASTLQDDSIPQVAAIKVNATTYGFDSINFSGSAGFPPFIPAIPAIKLVRVISGSDYGLSYVGNMLAIGSSGSYTGILVQSPSSASLIAPRITISATSASVVGSTVFTGSITGSANSYLNFEILQLRALSTLPAGALGMLAVSGTDLYFHNGSGWQLK